MLSMLTLIRGTINASTALRSVTTLQRAVGAELLVVCSDLGTPFTLDEIEEAREQARRAYDFVCATETGCRYKLVAGPVSDVLRKQSLFMDLCALPRRSGLAGDDLGLLKAALVDAGAVTILLPPEPIAAAPKSVVLSWNGQAATAHAIKAAIPFAQQAERVLVLEHAGNEVNRSRLEHFLGSHGIEPKAWRAYGDRSLTARGRARALLDATRIEGGELLVMGAYGDATERLFRFGRATEKVASAARIPVLLSC